MPLVRCQRRHWSKLSPSTSNPSKHGLNNTSHPCNSSQTPAEPCLPKFRISNLEKARCDIVPLSMAMSIQELRFISIRVYMIRFCSGATTRAAEIAGLLGWFRWIHHY
ncbi:hypothetical protein LIER_30607 [Lithospermum erythrorhizon]|uniref:Uncharacterized protein n=1 Tax=Lithospermum erythrorhizon TaxID=34254 RepID=A0AAV3RRY6_LITER